MDATIDKAEDGEIVRPNPAALVESLRAVGYSLETAIADLLDNSVAANAKNIWLDFEWAGPNSYICLSDDGHGMSEAQLTEAMRIGSKNPKLIREKKDLGRFGLGLKTASFSQCRSLTVMARAGDTLATSRRWDLDHISETGDWHLLRNLSAAGAEILSTVPKTAIVTVIWEKLDRVIDASHSFGERGHNLFNQKIESVERHLSMVFHRFLSGTNKLRIFINGNLIQGWDPFMSDEVASQALPKEYVEVPSGIVEVIPHILPHRTKVSAEIYDRAEGPKGWAAQQGFYVYRNNRLLVAGSWLGLGFQKKEQFALARLQIDLPNTMDEDWQIDVKKSRASPPAMAREHLALVARWTRERAAEVFKGRRVSLERSHSGDFVFTWIPKVRRGRTFYTINRDQPLIAKLNSLLGVEKNILQALLGVIEETVPLEQIWLTGMEKPLVEESTSIADNAELIDAAAAVYKILSEQGLTQAEMRKRLLEIEPYHKFPDVVDKLLAQHRGVDK